MEEIGGDGRKLLPASEVEDEGAVLSLPSGPAVGERSTAEKTVGEGFLAQGTVFSGGRDDPFDAGAEGLAAVGR